MKHTILAIFAHPDDESFGPGGTLALLSKVHDIILISVTGGEACSLPDGYSRKTIKSVRKKELVEAATKLGIKRLYVLDFPDGGLTNGHIPIIADEIEQIARATGINSIITFEPNGFSGHLDHIAVTAAATKVYQASPGIESIHYFAINEFQRQFIGEYFVCVPAGYTDEVLNTVVDVSTVWQQKIDAIGSYQSQKGDINFWQPMLDGYTKHEHFISEYKMKEIHPFELFLTKEYLIKIESSQLNWQKA